MTKRVFALKPSHTDQASKIPNLVLTTSSLLQSVVPDLLLLERDIMLPGFNYTLTFTNKV